MVVDELFEAGEEGHSITLRGSHCPEVPRPASVDRLPRMRQGFFGAALPGLPGAAVTEGVVTVQCTSNARSVGRTRADQSQVST